MLNLKSIEVNVNLSELIYLGHLTLLRASGCGRKNYSVIPWRSQQEFMCVSCNFHNFLSYNLQDDICCYHVDLFVTKLICRAHINHGYREMVGERRRNFPMASVASFFIGERKGKLM